MQHLAVAAVDRGALRDAAVAHDGPQRLPAGRFAVGVPGRQPGVVDQHGLRSHQDGVDPSAQGVVVGKGFRAGNPLAGAVAGGDPAVQGLRDVQGDEGPFGGDGVEPAPVQVQRLDGAEPGTDPDTRCAQRRRTAGSGVVRVVDGVDDVGDAGVDDRLGAGAGPSAVVAGLQGDQHGGAVEVEAGGGCLGDRVRFRVGRAGTAVVAGHQPGSVGSHDDGAHQRVGAPRTLPGCGQGRVHGADLGGAESGAFRTCALAAAVIWSPTGRGRRFRP